MPTIDQLAPATAASDNDELLASQIGIARKVTRAQVLAGVQPQLAIRSGTLLGRVSGGTGGPEQISIGANLALTNGAPLGQRVTIQHRIPGSRHGTGEQRSRSTGTGRRQYLRHLQPVHERPGRHHATSM